MRKESLARGAFALVIAGFLVKVSGLALRIPLTRLIRSEGLGIYQMALPAFHALYAVASGGIPVAVNNLVSEYTVKGKEHTAEDVLRISLAVTGVLGGLAACALLVLAPWLAAMLGDKRAYHSLVAVAPAIYLYALDSCYRNYLMGRQVMTPNAVASVVEQAVRLLTTLLAAYLLMGYGSRTGGDAVEWGAAGAALGMTAGAAASLLWVVAAYRRVRVRGRRPDAPRVRKRVLGLRMMRLAWPVTLAALILPFLGLIDVGIVQRGFQAAGLSVGEATAMYGYYQGIALQVVWFPIILTSALTNALVPSLTGLKASGEQAQLEQKVLLALRACGLVGLPAAVGVAILSGPIAGLFGEPKAATALLWLAPLTYLGPLCWMIAGILQAVGKTGVPLRNFGVALVLKLLLDYLLAPRFEIRGVAAASVILFVVACWLNVRALERELEQPLPWTRLLAGPLLASLAMGAGLAGILWFGLAPSGHWGRLLYSLALAPLLYLILLLVSGALSREELRYLGGPLAPRLERLWQQVWPW
jgi:stage V sporulation protein B